jgi:xylan 1,4-beta-xylosidase
MQKRMGLIRLPALPAPDARHARTFTEYVCGPRSSVTVTLGAAGLKPGDVAGLALSNTHHAWLGVERGSHGFTLTRFDEQTGKASRVPLTKPRIRLRAQCDFVDNTARFNYSTDGKRYAGIGEPCSMGDGQIASKGVRCSLFAYSTRAGAEGGHADFDSFLVTWP